MKIFVDTNVVLDVLLKQEPFYQDSFEIFQLADEKRISGCLSSASITDIFYLLRKKLHNAAGIYSIMDDLVSLFSVAAVSDLTISSALSLRWKDFEDAVQFTAAKENNVEYIITRNKADFESTDIPCMSPAEFITFIKHHC